MYSLKGSSSSVVEGDLREGCSGELPILGGEAVRPFTIQLLHPQMTMSHHRIEETRLRSFCLGPDGAHQASISLQQHLEQTF